MNIRHISATLSSYLFIFLLPLALAASVSLFYESGARGVENPMQPCFGVFIQSMALCSLLAIVLHFFGKTTKRDELHKREGLFVVVLIWFISGVFGALPFYLSQTLTNPVDAYFEAISGLTTTGASVMMPKAYSSTGEEIPIVTKVIGPHEKVYTYFGTIAPAGGKTGIDAVAKGLLFWRSLMQWLGGGGIVVFIVAILPALGVGGKVLFGAEVTGPIKDGLTPRVKETAMLLWMIYIISTAVEIGLLMVTNQNIDLFAATTTAFSTISTGGYAIYGSSAAAFDSPLTQWLLVIFMFLGGVNLSVYYFAWQKKWTKLLDPELIVYTISILCASAYVSWHLVGYEKILLDGQRGVFSTAEAMQHGFFQVVSAQTSTGFATADFNRWPSVCQVVLLTVMYIGGMSGSTAGGMKIVRLYLCAKIIRHRLEELYRPNAVLGLYFGKSEISAQAASNVLCYIIIVMTTTAIGTLYLVLDGVDPETAMTVNACMINNTGMAFRAAGPTESFAFLSNSAKLISCFEMILGRLEFFAVLVLLLPSFWSKK